jgi:lysophospholipase L1-like esterase
MDRARGAVPPALAAVGAVVVMALVAIGVWARRDVDTATGERSDQPSLVMVGDSVTFLSIGAIEDALADGHRLDIRAYPGQRSNELVLVVLQEVTQRAEAGEPLDLLTLLVGYNDVLRHSEQPGEVAEMVALAARARCAVALTVPAPPDWADQDDLASVQAEFAAYNERLVAEVERHDSVHLWTGWQEAVEASERGELVDTDGVHPVEAGQGRLAEEYAAALAEHC